MRNLKFTFFAVLALWLSGCGVTGLQGFNPNDNSKVVIANNPSSPKDEPPLVPDSNGVLVRAAIPGVPVQEATPPPAVTFSGIEQ